ncbi:MAG TPA: hypothetical protein DHV36_02115 [Desulfobacteraceae bacterium]|nr:hypothetical protein [Desulfobacteraceae bacterium]
MGRWGDKPELRYPFYREEKTMFRVKAAFLFFDFAGSLTYLKPWSIVIINFVTGRRFVTVYCNMIVFIILIFLAQKQFPRFINAPRAYQIY